MADFLDDYEAGTTGSAPTTTTTTYEYSSEPTTTTTTTDYSVPATTDYSVPASTDYTTTTTSYEMPPSTTTEVTYDYQPPATTTTDYEMPPSTSTEVTYDYQPPATTTTDYEMPASTNYEMPPSTSTEVTYDYQPPATTTTDYEMPASTNYEMPPSTSTEVTYDYQAPATTTTDYEMPASTNYEMPPSTSTEVTYDYQAPATTSYEMPPSTSTEVTYDYTPPATTTTDYDLSKYGQNYDLDAVAKDAEDAAAREAARREAELRGIRDEEGAKARPATTTDVYEVEDYTGTPEVDADGNYIGDTQPPADQERRVVKHKKSHSQEPSPYRTTRTIELRSGTYEDRAIADTLSGEDKYTYDDELYNNQSKHIVSRDARTREDIMAEHAAICAAKARSNQNRERHRTRAVTAITALKGSTRHNPDLIEKVFNRMQHEDEALFTDIPKEFVMKKPKRPEHSAFGMTYEDHHNTQYQPPAAIALPKGQTEESVESRGLVDLDRPLHLRLEPLSPEMQNPRWAKYSHVRSHYDKIADYDFTALYQNQDAYNPGEKSRRAEVLRSQIENYVQYPKQWTEKQKSIKFGTYVQNPESMWTHPEEEVIVFNRKRYIEEQKAAYEASLVRPFNPKQLANKLATNVKNPYSMWTKPEPEEIIRNRKQHTAQKNWLKRSHDAKPLTQQQLADKFGWGIEERVMDAHANKRVPQDFVPNAATNLPQTHGTAETELRTQLEAKNSVKPFYAGHPGETHNEAREFHWTGGVKIPDPNFITGDERRRLIEERNTAKPFYAGYENETEASDKYQYNLTTGMSNTKLNQPTGVTGAERRAAIDEMLRGEKPFYAGHPGETEPALHGEYLDVHLSLGGSK